MHIKNVMKVLFIGGTGNISSYASKVLLENGMDLYLFNRGNTKVDLPGAKLIKGNIRNKAPNNNPIIPNLLLKFISVIKNKLGNTSIESSMINRIINDFCGPIDTTVVFCSPFLKSVGRTPLRPLSIVISIA